jgi:hypothetical protein
MAAALDEKAYLNALLWHLNQYGDAALRHDGIGYTRTEARVFERVVAVFADPWAARIWLEFARIDPPTGLTPRMACDQASAGLALSALDRHRVAPLPWPDGPADEASWGRWLACAGIAGPNEP